MLYDTHVHLDILIEKLKLVQQDLHEINKNPFEEIDLFINFIDINRIEIELNRLLINHEFTVQSTVSLGNYYLCKQIFGKLKKYYLMLGLHPEIIDEDFDLSLYLTTQTRYFEENDVKIVGIGEIGLDYYYKDSPKIKEIQKNAVISQIKFANQLKLPVIFHLRDKVDRYEVFDDFFDIIKICQPENGFIIHCFTGTLEIVKQVIKHGGLIGIGGICTFNNAGKLQNAIIECPIENITLETDLPYLSPSPNRGKICLPQYIEIIAQKIAELKNIDKRDVLSITRENAIRIFKI